MEVKPKLLFLDDRTKRIMAVNRAKDYSSFDVTIVTNVKECLRHLSRYDWDVVSLDHDLNGDDFQDPDDIASGMEIVRYIKKTSWPVQRKRPTFYVHSSNMFAANLMVEELASMGFNAYWHMFEVPNIEAPKKTEVPEPIDIPEWKFRGYGVCKACPYPLQYQKQVDINGDCKDCYDREARQCA